MDAVELLERLVAFKTVSPPGNEEPAARYLAGLLEPLGFSCQVQKLGDNRANLIARLGTGDGPELMLNGHLDVVPAPGNWSGEPFCMRRRDGLLFGRGTADMKGGIAAMCQAAASAVGRGALKRGRLTLLFTADEECSNLGLHKYLEVNRPPDCCIIGEPTGLQVAVAHRGVSRDYIVLKGASRHAALLPRKGDAVEKAARAVQALERLNQKLAGMSHPVLNAPSAAVTGISGYEKDNVVPGQVRLLVDFRLLPGMEQAQAEEILKQGLMAGGLFEDDFAVEPHFYMPGGELALDNPFLRLCLEERDRLLGPGKGPVAFGASCEQCFLAQAGSSVLICGPGELAQAHTVDEFTSEAQVRAAVRFYDAVIRRVFEE